LGFSELLLSNVEGPLNLEQRQMLQLINDNGRTLLQLIDDILDMAKLEALLLTKIYFLGTVPLVIASIIEAGGFETPVQFFQAGLIHAWFSRRR
jgi:signal transduction histidine kinase